MSRHWTGAIKRIACRWRIIVGTSLLRTLKVNLSLGHILGRKLIQTGRSYSGSLKYRQACRSVVLAHKLQFIQHYHYLLVPSGPQQNYVEVERDFSDLPSRMNHLLQNPRAAERIADNNVRTFRERYLTPAAEACYWRALWDGYKQVSNATDSLSRMGRPAVERGLRFESFSLLESNEMMDYYHVHQL